MKPKDEKFQYNQPNEPLRTPSSIASSTHSNTSSSSVDRMDCLNSFPQPQHRPSEVEKKIRDLNISNRKPTTTASYQKPEAQLDQNQKQFLQSTLNENNPWLTSIDQTITHQSRLGGNHYSNSPTLPPQFDRKARNVSNIVNLFEKAQPDIPLKQEQDKDGRPPMPPTYEIPEHRPSHVGSPCESR
ncbi:hypothetical protein H4Q26_002846 [Puccinia striiformis f. sp. tritici PST-130]|nr:hypothetical protein H4Q26_002846 [Puccinia striiformis f. sp. tritici PST-130]